MKAIFNLRKHSYLKTIGTLLIAVALIAGVVGCTPGETYTLTMAVNPTVGGTATDETGTSPYAEGTDVDIKAVAADCYRFVDWTAPAGTFGDANNTTTTFTMPARDVTVTANFEPVPPDHYKFYEVSEETLPIGEDVQLTDQFGTFEARVGYAISFGNPVEKVHADTPWPIEDLNRHYTLYRLDYGEGPMLDSWQVMIHNQFQDDVELIVEGPYYLAVPTQKEGHEMPECLDHLLVYEVLLSGEPEKIDEVDLHDQFRDELAVSVYEPVLFANPVQKAVAGGAPTPIEHEDEHYVFYPIGYEPFEKRIDIVNQFGEQTLDLLGPELLAVPSRKIEWEQPLNHFKVYAAEWAEGSPPEGFPVNVQLEDEFITDWLDEPLTANVTHPWLFANPAGKEVGLFEWTPIWNGNNHLTLYTMIYEEDPQMWEVVVNNQFGIGQWLEVIGPLYLAVPTQKEDHGPPVDLNHYMVYWVNDYEVVPDVEVYLWDQFTMIETFVGAPEFFAVPAQKTVPGSAPTPIIGDEHLLFYWIGPGEFWTPDLPIDNQFGPQFLEVWSGEGDFLGVPSDKITWSGPFPAPL